jgi:acyl-CoA synthetase (AMP-forming)/AMP-acid ligase II
VLIVDDAFLPLLDAMRTETHPVDTLIHAGDGAAPDGMHAYEGLIADNAPAADARRGSADLAGIFYTGGTTGFPKGVMLTHQALITSALGSMSQGEFLQPDARFLHCAPMFHLADMAACIAQSALGGTHVMIPGFEPVAAMRAIAEHGVTHTLLVPTMIQMLLDHPAFAEHDLSSLKRIVYGGSSITLGVLERAAERLPGVEFCQAYGMTELSPVATMLGPEDHRARRKLASAGRPAPHVEVRICDPEGTELARGEVGEICVRGANVMTGYWERPQETAAALRDGWMCTGDGGYMDDEGYLFVVDRIKDMIVTGGENVYCAEVENVLSTHPAVAACAVIGLPDEDWGERVHAVVVLAEGQTTDAQQLREHSKSRIAGYKAPRSVDFVDALPLSGAGKVLKRDLRERYAKQTA